MATWRRLVPLTGVVGLAALQAAWVPQTSGVTVRLRGVSAASEKVVWASGARGTVLRTTDGGATWQSLTVPDASGLDFRDIDAVSENTAYVLSIGNGPASRIYKTTDAGATWTLQFRNDNPRAFFDAMAFWDPDHGLAVSDSVDGQFVILRTEDGGRTWARVPASGLPAAQPDEGYFAASGTNIAVSGQHLAWIGTGAASVARVLRTTDDGRTWQVADTPLAAGPTSGIYSIAFRDADHGLVVGGDYAKEQDARDNAATTDDGGRTWTLTKGLGGFRSVVAYVPRSRSQYIAVGPSGADFTNDDGRTWRPIAGAGYDTFSFAPGKSVGWAAGSRGRIGWLNPYLLFDLTDKSRPEGGGRK